MTRLSLFILRSALAAPVMVVRKVGNDEDMRALLVQSLVRILKVLDDTDDRHCVEQVRSSKAGMDRAFWTSAGFRLLYPGWFTKLPAWTIIGILAFGAIVALVQVNVPLISARPHHVPVSRVVRSPKEQVDAVAKNDSLHSTRDSIGATEVRSQPLSVPAPKRRFVQPPQRRDAGRVPVLVDSVPVPVVPTSDDRYSRLTDTYELTSLMIIPALWKRALGDRQGHIVCFERELEFHSDRRYTFVIASVHIRSGELILYGASTRDFHLTLRRGAYKTLAGRVAAVAKSMPASIATESRRQWRITSE